jgi:hypothetical protein
MIAATGDRSYAITMSGTWFHLRMQTGTATATAYLDSLGGAMALAERWDRHPLGGPVTAPMITPAQLRYLQLLLRKRVADGRDEDARNRRHGFLAWMVNREITSTTDLTRSEASRLIDGLASEEEDA